MANTDVDPNLDPYSQEPVSPRAATALSGGDEDAEERAYRRQRRQQFEQQFKREEEISAREQQQLQQRETELAPRRKALEQATEKSVSDVQSATNKFLTNQADIPKFDANAAKTDAFAWMSLAAGFGAIAGGLSRYHTTAALNAFSGMMNGFAKGQLEVYQQKYQEWQANVDRVHEYNARSQREYNAVMSNAKLDIDAKSNLMQMTAEKWQDALMATQAQQRSLERMTQLMNARENFDQNMLYKQQQLGIQHERINAQLATKGYKVTEDENGKVKVIPDPDNPGYMDDQTLNVMVERRLLGDKTVIQNIGRGTQGPMNLGRFNRALAETMTRRGFSAQDLIEADQQYAGGQSYQVAAGRYASRVEGATAELQSAIPLAEKSSAAFPRDSDWVAWNTLNNLYKAGKSDPKYNDFIVKTLAVRNAYVRAMNPTGSPRIAERLELQADKILDAAIGNEAYDTQLRGMWQEAENSRAAIAATRGLPIPEPRPFPTVTIGTPQVTGGGGPREFHYDPQGNPVQ